MKQLLTIEQCRKLPTHRLLAYYKSIRTAGTYCEFRDSECPCIDEAQRAYNQKLETLQTQIKAILDTREHVKT